MDLLFSCVTHPKDICKYTTQIYSVSSHTINFNMFPAFLLFGYWRVDQQVMNTYDEDELDVNLTPGNLESRKKKIID